MKWIRRTFRKKKKSILDIKSEHFGYQDRKLSEELDEILYDDGKD